jgi:hypothetical protein
MTIAAAESAGVSAGASWLGRGVGGGGSSGGGAGWARPPCPCAPRAEVAEGDVDGDDADDDEVDDGGADDDDNGEVGERRLLFKFISYSSICIIIALIAVGPGVTLTRRRS